MSDSPANPDIAVTAPLPSDAGAAPLGTPWQEQDGLLRDLWMQNKTPQYIGEILGRSVPAIMTRAARLGLPRRSAPGRKPGAGSTRRFAALDDRQKEDETPLEDKPRRAATPNQSGEAYVAPAAQATLRICLMCLRKFESTGRHNRICAPCKGSSEYAQASALPDAQLPEG
jgi:hypothetical protein